MQSLIERQNNKTKFFAIVALRAYVKALELEEGIPAGANNSPFRYEINDASDTAVVLDTWTGEVAFADSIAIWANEGKSLRLAFIGLRASKLQLEAELERRGSRNHHIRYRFDAHNGEGFLLNAGRPISGLPVETEDWADLGEQVEKSMFAQLQAANQKGATEEVRQIKALMEKVGILRPRAGSESSAPSTSS